MDHPVRLADAQELQQKFSSSCNISEPELHQVFLSHAGKQKPFVIDLYNAFLSWPRCPRIDPFFDKNDKSLPKGEEFPDRIFEAARNCVVAVVILTKEYVTSKWPMLELLTFVEAQKTTNPGLKLLPVFYDDLPNSNIDSNWIAAWENMKPKHDHGTSSAGRKSTIISVELCEKAMRKLRKSNGLVLRNDKSLQSLQEEIVEAAVNFLPASSSEMDTENVQGCLRLCESISKMLQKNGRGVDSLGLYGVGGLGKTTMCKELCSYFGPRFFYKVCHVEIGSNDTDTEEKKFKRHIKILESLSDMPRKQISTLDYHKAEKCVQQCLNNKKPKFLAVDNVHDTLASQQEAESYLRWLSAESIVIITSRSRDNLLSVNPNDVMPCRPIPNLDKEEAMTLFLKIAAPEVDRQSLNLRHIQILEKCLQICYFSRKKEINHDQVPVEDGGHYHPLALRAVAAYFRDRYTGPDSILCWKEVLKARNVMSLLSDSVHVFDVLGLGFNDKNMTPLSKQLFIDVALFAPEKNILNSLVSIHYECQPEIIREKLRQLRKKSFVNYDDDMPSQKAEETCKNIRVHELYKEFAKGYISRKDAQGMFNYGIYDGGDLPPPPLEDPGWATVPRICLRRLATVAKMKEWCNVSVVNLFGCETITTVSIGELVSLRSLGIADCPKLEVLSWTQASAPKPMCGTKLCFVYLSSNKSLRKLPDFSNCSELQNMTVEGCSTSVEPIRLHTCSNLQVLGLMGNDVPEVQSIQSCPKLNAVRLAWKATQKSLPFLDDLHSLSSLQINGPSDVPFDQMDHLSPSLGENQFRKQHPEDSVFYELPGEGMLTNLQEVELTCLPLGKLSGKLATGGSSLRILILSGCLLSESVDFSAFPNLRHLRVRWTNVEEICGLEHLNELIHLDCNYCFRLRKVPDLSSLSKLEVVYFLQCPKLQGIPRLPPGCVRKFFSDVVGGGSEDELRAIFATLAFAKTTARALPSPGFGIRAGKKSLGVGFPRGNRAVDGSRCIPSQFNGGWAIHLWVACDGCRMFPIVGHRYNAKPVSTLYSLCSNCFSKTCSCSDQRRKLRWKAEGKLTADYDLCSLCYRISGCDLLDFYEIDQTCFPDQGPQPKDTFVGYSSEFSISVSGVPACSTNNTDRFTLGSFFTVKVKESPFNMPRRKLNIRISGS